MAVYGEEVFEKEPTAYFFILLNGGGRWWTFSLTIEQSVPNLKERITQSIKEHL